MSFQGFNAKPPAINRLRGRFLFEAPVDTSDGVGGVERTYTPLATLWGLLVPETGSERWRTDRFEATVSHRLEIRWRAGLSAALRVRTGTRVFDVKAVADPDGRRVRLVCLLEEVGL